MNLKESKGNMYEFITHTWNPMGGRCPHGCAYCYMKYHTYIERLYLDERELKGTCPAKLFIFIGSNTDVFAAEMPSAWINKVLDFCVNVTSNQKDDEKTRFLLQTKNPARVLEFINHPLLKNGQAVVCTTLETNRHYPDIMNNAPLIKDRAKAMAAIADYGVKTYVTIEPIMDFDLDEFIGLLKMCKPEQVNIGAESQHFVQIPQPSEDKLTSLILQLLCFTKVTVKKNLNGEVVTQNLINRIKQNYSYEKKVK